MQRTRDWYLALGYGHPYEWAHYRDVPFQPLKNRLSRSRVALITTAAPYQDGKGEQGPGAAYNAQAKFFSVYSGDTSADHDLLTLADQAETFVKALKGNNDEVEELRMTSRTHQTIVNNVCQPDDPLGTAMLRFIRAHAGKP